MPANSALSEVVHCFFALIHSFPLHLEVNQNKEIFAILFFSSSHFFKTFNWCCSSASCWLTTRRVCPWYSIILRCASSKNSKASWILFLAILLLAPSAFFWASLRAFGSLSSMNQWRYLHARQLGAPLLVASSANSETGRSSTKLDWVVRLLEVEAPLLVLAAAEGNSKVVSKRTSQTLLQQLSCRHKHHIPCSCSNLFKTAVFNACLYCPLLFDDGMEIL